MTQYILPWCKRSKDLPSHLGGHCGRTWVDEGSLTYMFQQFNVCSMLDFGCGPGGMKVYAKKLGISWLGVDGDFTQHQEDLIIHDFSSGSLSTGEYDLAWSVEFLEHVEEEYMDNYMAAFSSCKYVICTAAPPGWEGTHHVNTQPRDYWISAFSRYGFDYCAEELEELLKHSTMQKRTDQSFLEMTGMFFVRKESTDGA